MPADVAIFAASFLERHDAELTAAGSVVLAIVLAVVVDRVIVHRAEALAHAVARGELNPVAATRLRFLRRLVGAAIVLIGVAIALSQFDALDRVATGVLASGALAAAVIGFAARQTFANVVAGVMLAITQPLRIGDAVEFEGEAGVVEDVRLNYTFLRAADGRRVIIPNERLAAGVLRNSSIVEGRVAVEASVWVPLDADPDAALAALEGLEDASGAAVAEVTADGVRLVVSGEPTAPAGRAAAEARLRLAALRALRGGA